MKNLIKGLGASSIALSGGAMAAVPVGVTTSLTDAATDSVTVAGLVLAVIVGVMAFKYMRRAL